MYMAMKSYRRYGASLLIALFECSFPSKTRVLPSTVAEHFDRRIGLRIIRTGDSLIRRHDRSDRGSKKHCFDLSIFDRLIFTLFRFGCIEITSKSDVRKSISRNNVSLDLAMMSYRHYGALLWRRRSLVKPECYRVAEHFDRGRLVLSCHTHHTRDGRPRHRSLGPIVFVTGCRPGRTSKFSFIIVFWAI